MFEISVHTTAELCARGNKTCSEQSVFSVVQNMRAVKRKSYRVKTESEIRACEASRSEKKTYFEEKTLCCSQPPNRRADNYLMLSGR